MKALLLLALATLPLGPASAQSAGTPQLIFSCMAGKKIVSVSSVGLQLVYRFGTLAKPEMAIIGDAHSNNVFWMTQRYAGIEQQLRFKNGDYSYAVYSMEGNGRTGVNPVSGLVVFRGTKSIADLPCSKFTEFTGDFDFSTLPEDGDAYSAM